MEQRNVISVIFLACVIAIALLLFSQYNKPTPPAVSEPRTGRLERSAPVVPWKGAVVVAAPSAA